eukprot:c18446_g1_i6.p1 GENE.c18446_g1_i6~~c18446_g1_i6.p1  ORF type:complete len:112 (+),score=20.02 c18446_g1_i6:35-370(+)
MSTLPAELDECVGNLEKSIGALESTLSDLLDQPMEEICPSDDPHAVARLQVSLAYALNASFFIYLKTQGVSPKDHPVKKELVSPAFTEHPCVKLMGVSGSPQDVHRKAERP